MKRKPIWPWLIFAALVVSLTASCQLFRDVTGMPPDDAWTVLPNGTMTQGPDGQLDPQFVAWVEAQKSAANTLTGGQFAWLLELLKQGATALAAYMLARKQDSKDKAELMKEISVTDKNVATVAKAASVPDSNLE